MSKKLSKKIPVYVRDKKTGKLKSLLTDYTYKSGVYFIYETPSSGKPIYIGQSQANLYKTILRHFQEWNDGYETRTGFRTRDRVVYPKFGPVVRVIVCSPQKAARLERALIRKFKPQDNPQKYQKYGWSEAELNDFWDNNPDVAKSAGFNDKFDFTRQDDDGGGLWGFDLTEALPF